MVKRDASSQRDIILTVVLAGPTTSTSASASRGPGERRAARSSAAPRMLHAASAANAASVTPSGQLTITLINAYYVF